MSIVDGQWQSNPLPDDEQLPNHHSIDELARLVGETEFDIVIVGGGTSGAAAAIESRDRGASVLVLEKMAAPGGSAPESGGSFRMVQDREATTEHFWRLAQGGTPREVVAAFVDGLAELPEWVKAHGGELVARPPDEFEAASDLPPFPLMVSGSPFPNFPFAEAATLRASMRPVTPARRGGSALWDFLNHALTELDVPVVLGARALRLVQRFPERAVIGVEVGCPGGTVTVRAQKAVILACGGFAYDQEMMLQYFGIALPALSKAGRATGDGIRMAQDVGADLWHMSAPAATLGFSFPELGAGFPVKIASYGFVMVDQHARRYLCETAMETHSFGGPMMTQDPLTGEFSRTPSFIILDDATRRSGMLGFLGLGANRNYPWSADNSAEVARGWIAEGATLTELGERLGLPAETLLETVDAYNRCVETGSTDAFGRAPDKMRPITTPPFYGAAVYPAVLNTQGGPRRNARCEVVRPDGTPIPGLYSAGELGSLWNRLYPGSGNISEAVVTGRIAVRSALE